MVLSTVLSTQKQNPCKSIVYKGFCGERGIRTPGGVTLNSFQDCRIRPLCHFSYAVANIHSLFEIRKVFLKNDMPIFTLSFIYGNHHTIQPSIFSGN